MVYVTREGCLRPPMESFNTTVGQISTFRDKQRERLLPSSLPHGRDLQEQGGKGSSASSFYFEGEQARGNENVVIGDHSPDRLRLNSLCSADFLPPMLSLNHYGGKSE